MTRHRPKKALQTMFLLGNGRSGTRFLCSLFRNNAADCTAVHEPYLVASRPSMFGRPIYDYTHGHLRDLRATFRKKERGIRSYRTGWYVETNHAFLKSFADLAMEAFPDMRLVHIIRNPLRSCASQVEREHFNHRYRVPYRYYTGRNGRRYYRWRLTGDEPIYEYFDADELTLFQKFFVQWIEVENRAQRFLDRYQKREACFRLHTPADLNNPQKIQEMFAFLGVPLRAKSVELRGVRNVTPGLRPAPDPDLIGQMRYVVNRLPDEYLTVFETEPYDAFAWAELLRKSTASTTTHSDRSY